ncbi:MAG TPA: histidine kinase [Clostridiaceae bacterium]|nr:histidine kinase [Clostridiaceae bacterium]
MKQFPFKNKLFLSYAAIIVVIVCIFTMALIFLTAPLNREIELRHQTSIFENSLKEMESILSDMEFLGQQVSFNTEILNCFATLSSDLSMSNYFTQNLTQSIRISSILQDINGVQSFASRIILMNHLGDYISAGTLYELDELVYEFIRNSNSDTLYEELKDNEEGQIFRSRHKDYLSNNPDVQLISLKRALKIPGVSKIYGVVEIEIDIRKISLFHFWKDGDSEYLLLDEQGNIIYPVLEKDESILEIYSYVNRKLKHGSISSFETDYNGESVIATAAHVQPSNWILLRIFPSSKLSEPYISNYISLVSGGLILLVMLLVIIYYLVDRLTSPLRALATSVRNVRYQNMRIEMDETQQKYSTEELEALNNAFHNMLTRLNKSFRAEMQAYMRALQSQADPHFLYNMLSVIIASSESFGDNQTVSMCLKLTAMLRYIADFDEYLVTMKDEIDHARNYLDLMKDRYEDMLSYEIEVDERAEKVIIPKLVVQPLVENCFKHGFKGRPPWRIVIKATADNDRWSLTVSDNGAGISEETISIIKQKLEHYKNDVAVGYSQLKIGGMGLLNTLLRLTLLYEEPFKYYIGNNDEGGTIIEIGGTLYDSCDDSGRRATNTAAD